MGRLDHGVGGIPEVDRDGGVYKADDRHDGDARRKFAAPREDIDKQMLLNTSNVIKVIWSPRIIKRCLLSLHPIVVLIN